MLTRIGNRIRTLVTAIIVAFMVTAGLVAPVDVAAQNQSLQSQLTGVTITYGPQYELQPDGVYEPNTFESMMFIGPADILAVGFMTPILDLNGARDILLEGLLGTGVETATIDRGDYTGVSYSLDMINLDGMEMGAFTLFMNQRSHGFSEFYIFMAPPALFATTMQTAQNSFTIDGSPLMEGVDATTMGNMVMANEGMTGGTAVTDVDEVTEATEATETTVATEPVDTTTTQTTEPDSNARAEYLAAVEAEYNLANAELANFLIAFQDYADEVITADEARPIFNSSMEALAGASDRAAAIQPPAGMESFHQEFLAWAQSMTDVGDAWFAFLDQTGTSDAHSQAIGGAVPINESFGALMDAELAKPAADTSGQQTQTTQTTQTTQAGAGDRDAYLTAVQTEYDAAGVELVNILSTLQAMSDETMTAQEARPITDAAHVVLAGTNDRIANIQPPVGMESFHQEFVAWSQAMTDLGDGWADAIAIGDTTAYQPLFTAAIETHTAFGDTLDIELANTGANTAAETTATEEATDLTGNTAPTRTTRSTTATATEEATETTGTTRPTRSNRPSGTTGGNTSETSGNSSSTTSTDSPNDYLEAVRAEYDYVNEQINIIITALDGLSNETMTPQDAIGAINDANVELAAAETRIAEIEAPAGMETFHEEFLVWNESVVDTGLMWVAFTAEEVEASDYTDTLFALIDDTDAFGELLEAEEAGAGRDNNGSKAHIAIGRELMVA